MPYQPSFDRRLPGRIKKYLESSPGADSRIMADDLQKTFKTDYGRRKRTVFRLLVAQVHKDILNSEEFAHAVLNENVKKKKKKLKQNSSSASCSDEDVRLVEYKNTNMMNKSMASIYTKEEKPNKKLTPSKQPLSFDETTASGWFIDKGPLKATPSIDADATDGLDRVSQVDIKDSTNEADSNSCYANNLNTNGTHTLQETGANVDDDLNNQQNINENESVNKKAEAVKRKKVKKDLKSGKKVKKRRTDEANEEDFIPPVAKKQFELKKSDVTFADFAGNEASLQELARLLLHMSHPEIYSTLGVSPPRGVLLHGPPGCGKTLLGNAVAGQLNLPMLRLAGPELIGGVSGESERRVREVFDTATDNAPCVLFLDEIDAVAQRRENSSKDMERRIVAQILTCMDDLNRGTQQVMVVGATNRPEMLDTALRRAGRFDREICLGIPDEKARTQILQVLCKNLKLADDVSFQLIARLTPGYVGADLLSLCREAAMHAVNRILNVTDKGDVTASQTNNKENILELLRTELTFDDDLLQSLHIQCQDFQLAVGDVQPSAKREGFATVPDVTFDDVGALESIREELSIAILGPVRNPAAFAALGLSRASGVLLAGPPGCGKTMLAKAVANQSGINFVSVKGPELLNMYVGESERAVRQCFERARNSSPCVIFFDELDSLCPRRTSAESGASARVVNQMLTELDGLESRKQVFVIAATNRPDIIDPAVLRPGRLDKTLYVGIPTKTDLVKILSTITKNGTRPQFTDDVDLEAVARDERCSGFTGADISALVRESSLNALRSSICHGWDEIMPDEDATSQNLKVSMENINAALNKIQPSISVEDRRRYESLCPKLHIR